MVSMQSKSLTIKICEFDFAHGEVYRIWFYEIKFCQSNTCGMSVVFSCVSGIKHHKPPILCTLDSSTNKTEEHDTNEIL
jgi:hypothetical protein